jgi:SET domain-containing protein
MAITTSIRRFAVRRSSVHGRGVFALADIDADDEIVNYAGEVITAEVAQERYSEAAAESGHTFLFDRGDGTVIDGGRGGNSSRWINHGCDPNCEAIDYEGRIVIHARRAIHLGEELLIDYQLIVDKPRRAATRALYACRCGASSCRGTMLAN